jgi:hypothetical protein
MSKKATPRKSDDFKSVARRLECDEDRERFEKKLGKIAKATPKPKPKKVRK